jgi:Zn-dependent peptidase ImmA (M78 family)
MSTELPPTEKGRHYELRALGLRDFASLREGERLDPFVLAQLAKIMVVDLKNIEGLSAKSRTHLLTDAKDDWSGGACSTPLPNNWRLVILNPNHGRQRNNVTLMEEICHVFLGHRANRLAVVLNDDPVQTVARDYVKSDEQAAYGTGAAALVPFSTLRKMVASGKSSREMAHRFDVSRQLIEYRIKVSKLWNEYTRL